MVGNIVKQIESIADAQGSTRVVGVLVKIGALSSASPEQFREQFELLSRGTVAEKAKLNFDVSTRVADLHAQEVILESIDVLEE